MSADLNTFINLQGDKEQLLSMITVLKKFSNENFEEYKEKKDCAYIEWVDIKGTGDSIRVDNASEELIMDFLESAGNELVVNASGPYGVFNELSEVGLFEELAVASPEASFKATVSGFVTGADVSLRGELKEGKLYLSEYYMPDEEVEERYSKYIIKILSHAKFCKMFKVDKEDLEKEEYSELIAEAIDAGFPDMEYDEFLDYFEMAEVEEDDYDMAIEKVQEIEFVDYDTFREELEEDENNLTCTVFDPLTKKYKKI